MAAKPRAKRKFHKSEAFRIKNNLGYAFSEYLLPRNVLVAYN
jgi:hypothetical protein